MLMPRKNILLHQNAFSKTVLNLDNEISNSFSSEVRGQLVKFSRRNTVANGAYLEDNKIVYSDYGKETEIIDIKDIFYSGYAQCRELYGCYLSSMGELLMLILLLKWQRHSKVWSIEQNL